MMDVIINNFPVIVGTILTIVFGGYIAFHVYRKKKRIETGETLITSFDKTINAINDYDGHFYLLENLLIKEFKTQRIAVRNFKRYINYFSRIRLNRAWNEYKGNNDNEPYFRQHMSNNNIQDSILKCINKILKFTK